MINKQTNQNIKMYSKKSITIEKDVIIKSNVEIYPNVTLLGKTVIGTGSKIFPNAVIIDSIIGDNCLIGTSSLIREGSIIGNNVMIGAHAEVCRSKINKNSSIHHKCVILDTHLHNNVLIGGGTITANYNFRNTNRKNKIIIFKNSLIGAQTTLVAPLIIGENVTIGAGSVILRDVEAHTLVVSKMQQTIKKKQK